MYFKLDSPSPYYTSDSSIFLPNDQFQYIHSAFGLPIRVWIIAWWDQVDPFAFIKYQSHEAVYIPIILGKVFLQQSLE
jgi:hypothetical protein